jgi:tricarballylate dehydrogenase
MSTEGRDFDVIVVGSGIAGLSAAVSAAEAGASVLVVERAGEDEAGGNTRWGSAYFRLDDVDDPGEGFASDVVGFSDGRTPRWYVDALLERLPETMDWVQGHGGRFRSRPTYFINSSRPRLQPDGGGQGLRDALRPAADRLGVHFRHDTTAEDLVADDQGRITGLKVRGPGGRETLRAPAVIIAAGGFEGDPQFLREELGGDPSTLVPIAPGVRFNRGEGIRMALAAGASRRGQWDSFHAEPVDPRSPDPEALVMVFPYGILVDRNARRFLDEGAGTVDETYEATARAIWSRDGGIAYFITDRQLEQVEDHPRGLLTKVEPIVADTIPELAAALELPEEALAETVAEFNAAVVGGPFDWRTPDGRRTEGIEPPKSNWAVALENPPFVAYPVVCSIVFTFGGLATDADARVVRDDDSPIEGLYAAGECTGLYYGKYPGGTSVMRGMVFGRVAGTDAARLAAGRSVERIM